MMEVLPEVSVVVPIFNVQNYIERCLKSLHGQLNQNTEVILVDDGSTDDSGIIASSFAKRFPKKFRIISQSNRGLGPARNVGAAAAQGKYVAFVDSDDWVEREFTSGPYIRAASAGADVVFFGYRTISEHGRLIETNYEINKEILGPREAMVFLSPIACNKMFRKDLLNRAGVRFPPIFHEDIAETCRLISFSNSIVKYNGVVYNYCRRTQSITGIENKKKAEDLIRACEILLDEAICRERFYLEFTFQAWKFLVAWVNEWKKMNNDWTRECIRRAQAVLSKLPESIEDNPYYYQKMIGAYNNSNAGEEAIESRKDFRRLFRLGKKIFRHLSIHRR
jgi:glycosyltransferase involved in cell wall biosynthesis